MKKTSLLFLLIFIFSSTFAVNLYTVGTGADYTTLKGAFDAINAGSITGDIHLRVISSTTETSPCSLNASGVGACSYTQVYIYPTGSGYSISGSLDDNLIVFNGADNVRINGRENGACGAADLSIENTSTGSSAQTLYFGSTAENNIIEFCNIKGANTSGTGKGTIYFSSSSKNTIANCNVGGTSTATYHIYGAASSDSVVVLNNNIFNFYSNTQSSVAGVYLSGDLKYWNISGNSFYQTTSRAFSGICDFYAIYISLSAATGYHTVQNNFIGGSAAERGGGAMTLTGSNIFGFFGIYYSASSSADDASIQGNVIQNITHTTLRINGFNGIYCEGNANIGTIRGNAIGDTTGTASITTTLAAASQTLTAYGIYVLNSDVSVNNNLIGSIRTIATDASSAYSITGINASSAGGDHFIVKNNVIGSVGTANSIYASSAGTSAAQTIYGILSSSQDNTDTIKGNTIANLSNGINTSSGFIVGIRFLTGLVLDNRIHDFTCAAYNSTNALAGIYAIGTIDGKIISQNHIYNFTGSYSGASAVTATGILISHDGGLTTNQITRNFVRNFVLNSTSNNSIMYGISFRSVDKVYNNIVELGTNQTNDCNIYGIYKAAATNNVEAWYNTAYIGGTAPSAAKNTYAFYGANTGDSLDVRQNIFENSRSTTTGVGQNYAIFAPASVANYVIDYNLYYAPNTGGILGYLSGDQTTLIAWQTATSQDANSKNIDPALHSPGGDLPTDYIIGKTVPMTLSPSIYATDFYEVNRSASSYPGALWGSYWDATTSTAFSTFTNWYNNVVPSANDNIVFAPSAGRNCIMDADFSTRDIVNSTIYDLDVNGYDLSVYGKTEFTGTGRIIANGSGSSVLFKGDELQRIKPNTYDSDEMEDLGISNPEGVALENDLSIVGSLGFSGAGGRLYLNGRNLTFTDDASISGADDNSYINTGVSAYIVDAVTGVVKVGDDAFTFQVGSDEHYAPIGISAPSVVSDAFSAYYRYQNPNYVNATMCNRSLDAGINHISGKEYWILNRNTGSSGVNVTLSWDTRSGGVDNLDSLVVCRWDGSQWANEGNTATAGNTAVGTVTSASITSFSPFTLGSTNYQNPLPVEMGPVESKCENGQVEVNWVTYSEINVDKFTLQKSLDGKSFSNLGSVKASNQPTKTTYQLMDDNTKGQPCYYRIKSIDLDGELGYSKTIYNNCTSIPPAEVKVFPNPSETGLFNVYNESVGTMQYYAFTPLGQLIKAGLINSGQLLDLDLQEMPSGIYTLHFVEQYNGATTTKKIVIQE